MTKQTEALKLALEALESVTKHFTRAQSTLRDSEVRGEAHKAITAIREALAQPQQEPVAWWHQKSDTFTSGSLVSNFVEWVPLYTSPPARKPLSEEEYTALAHRIASKYAHRSDLSYVAYTFLPHTLEQFVRAIEAAHGIKENT